MRIGASLMCLASGLAVSSAAYAQSPVDGYYDHGFVFETADGAYQLKTRGNLHFDTRLYGGPDRGAPHSFDIRRARLDFQGRIHRYVSFRVQPELADTPYIRNAWADFEGASWLHLRAGQMKVPFSSTWLTTDNNLNFLERSTSTPLYPFFDRGLTLWGELLGKSVVYNLGVYTGAGIDKDYTKGDIDDSKDVAGRLFLQPFRTLGASSSLHGLFLAAKPCGERCLSRPRGSRLEVCARPTTSPHCGSGEPSRQSVLMAE